MARIARPTGLVASTAELGPFNTAFSAVMVWTAQALQPTGPESCVRGDTMAIHDGLDVVGDLCRCDASFGGAHHATRLDAQLVPGTLAMLTEAIPTTWIDGVWVWFRSRH